MAGLRNTDEHYGWLAKLLHWLMALWVMGLFALGYWMRTLDYYSPWYQRAPELHKSLGVVLIVLIVVRLVWRVMNKPPRALGHHWLELLAARLTHGALHLLLVGLAVAGYLYATGEGKPLAVFGLVDIPPLFKSKLLAERAGDVHWWLAYSLMALTGLHVLGALKHHFVNGDDTLRRML